MTKLFEFLQVITGFMICGFISACDNGEPMGRQVLLVLGGFLAIYVFQCIKKDCQRIAVRKAAKQNNNHIYSNTNQGNCQAKSA